MKPLSSKKDKGKKRKKKDAPPKTPGDQNRLPKPAATLVDEDCPPSLPASFRRRRPTAMAARVLLYIVVMAALSDSMVDASKHTNGTLHSL